MIKDYKKTIAIIVPYAYFCSFLNLYYFWKPFGIQPFEYISLPETISYAIPFIVLSGFALFPVYAIEFLRKDKRNLNTVKETKYLVGFIVGLNFIFVILAELKTSLNFPVSLGIVTVIMSLAVKLSDTEELVNLLPSRANRLFIALIISTLPAVALTQASISNSPILKEKGYKYLMKSDLKESKDKSKLIYIGHLGDFIFTKKISSENTIIYSSLNFKFIEIHTMKEI